MQPSGTQIKVGRPKPVFIGGAIVLAAGGLGVVSFVVGWATLSPVSRRPCYTGVAENSVYVTSKARNQGIGLALMEALVTKADASRIWTIQTSVFPENAASLRLHERVGFRVIGRRERIAQLDGVWRDTLFLERRSPVVT